MKTIVKIIFINVALLFLAGCLGSPLGEGVYETREGVIERFISPNLAEDNYKKTYNVEYLLKMGNDKIYLISKKFNLGDKTYFGTKAQLSGTTYTIDTEKLMDVDDILVIGTPEIKEEVSAENSKEAKKEEPVVSETPEATDEGNFAATSDLLKKALNKTITKFEFVEPNYVYIYYEENGKKRSELLTYEILPDGKIDTKQVGLFKPGIVQDWDIISGTNPVASKKRNVLVVKDSGNLAQVTTVEEGFRYLESKPLKFRIQYPSNWYYARSGSGYAFSKEPVNETNALLTLKVTPGDSREAVVPRFLGATTISGGNISVSFQVSNGTIYDLIGAKEHQSLMEKMVQTVEITE